MSDYTPTTSHILEAFAWDEKYDGLDTKRMEQFYRWLSEIKKEVSTKAHFEHWLAEVKAQERKAERERTIKLLEDTPATRTTWIDDGISVYALDKDDFIALIKGEAQ